MLCHQHEVESRAMGGVCSRFVHLEHFLRMGEQDNIQGPPAEVEDQHMAGIPVRHILQPADVTACTSWTQQRPRNSSAIGADKFCWT